MVKKEMLDEKTKEKLLKLKKILVGKLPSFQAQLEQITTALIYKFMNDMDNEASEKGENSSFFIGDYKKYSWQNLFNPKLSGLEKVQLYSEAIESMQTNTNLPPLFREIFKNSFLPFRDPATLNLFLKEINTFHYSHSEKLGDAFEYFLSFMRVQGEGGYFRSPSHIIDFIVQIISPQKNETILDPACGTAGFLIASYKHILTQNNNKLNAEERKEMGRNLVGYDISPEMTRLSLVNMYLHQFTNPQIHEYDTLSSEEKWNTYYDIILANPPFSSPTGGIKPHSQFRIKSKRADLLFVDYIMEHLKPNGRAAIIVPEGIICQNGLTYKKLRKQLVEECLVGVISLPSGIFQPYSGVRTSILILDKNLHQKTDHIFFAKVENDGFSLTSKRKPISKNDLPSTVDKFKNFINDPKESDLTVDKKTIIESDGHSLAFFFHRQKESTFSKTENSYVKLVEKRNNFILVRLGDICKIRRGNCPRDSKRREINNGNTINFIKIGDAIEGEKYITNVQEKINKESAKKSSLVKKGDLILSCSMSVGKPYVLGIDGCVHDGWLIFEPDEKILDKDFLFCIFFSDIMQKKIKECSLGSVFDNVTKEIISKMYIPLPFLELQKQISKDLEDLFVTISLLNKVKKMEIFQLKDKINKLWQ